VDPHFDSDLDLELYLPLCVCGVEVDATWTPEISPKAPKGHKGMMGTWLDGTSLMITGAFAASRSASIMPSILAISTTHGKEAVSTAYP